MSTFAYVQYSKKNAASKAQSELDNAKVGDLKIKVSYAKNNPLNIQDLEKGIYPKSTGKSNS